MDLHLLTPPPIRLRGVVLNETQGQLHFSQDSKYIQVLKTKYCDVMLYRLGEHLWSLHGPSLSARREAIRSYVQAQLKVCKNK
jgi:hypothetical protein